MSKANDINDHKEAEKRRQRLALNLAAHFNEMLAENDKLKAENDKLKAENNKLRAENIELSSYDQKTSLHSGFRRLPLHSSQGLLDWYCTSFSCCELLSVSFRRRSTFGMTPSNGLLLFQSLPLLL